MERRQGNEEDGLGRYTRAFGVSLAITTVASALLVWLKETNPAVLEWMTRFAGHHWIAHGIFDVVLFVALGLGLAQVRGGEGVAIRGARLVALVVGAVALSVLLIAGFYLARV